MSCSKDSSDEPTEEPQIVQLTLSLNEAAPYQLISLQLPAGSQPAGNTATPIDVKLGNLTARAYPDTKAFANNTFTYLMYVPQAPAGDYKISVGIAGGNLAEANLKVNAFSTIANPNDYIQAAQAAAQTEISSANAEFDARVQEGLLTQSAADSIIGFMEQAYNETVALIAEMTNEEKQIYVQLIEANKHWLIAYKQVAAQNAFIQARPGGEGDCEEFRKQQTSAYNRGIEWEMKYWRLQADICESYREKERLVANSAFVKHMESSWEIAKQKKAEQSGWFKPYTTFVKTFMSEAVRPITETVKGALSFSKSVKPLELDDAVQEKMTAFEFELDKEYDFGAGINVTNISRETAGLHVNFADMIKAADVHNEAMEELAQFLPFTPTITVPAKKTEKIYVSKYTIDQLSDSRIQITMTEGGKGSRVKFGLNTPVVEEYIDFSFRVTVSTDYGNVSKVFNVTLYQPVEKLLVNASPWKVTQWIEGGVDQFTMHEIHRWECNNIEYINREKVLEATLTFSANGTGTSSEKYHEVYYENPSSQVCDVRLVDQVKTYGNTMNWTYDTASKQITAQFIDENGKEKTFTAGVTVQSGTVHVSGGGVTLSMVKK